MLTLSSCSEPIGKFALIDGTKISPNFKSSRKHVFSTDSPHKKHMEENGIIQLSTITYTVGDTEERYNINIYDLENGRISEAWAKQVEKTKKAKPKRTSVSFNEPMPNSVMYKIHLPGPPPYSLLYFTTYRDNQLIDVLGKRGYNFETFETIVRAYLESTTTGS